MEVLRFGYRIPFLSAPPLTKAPISMPYHPLSTKRVALGEATRALVAKGAVELAPLPSPGFYSRLFVVWKTSGSWRPVIDLSTLNLYVDVSHFRMETIQSVLLSVRQGDWMASIDLAEAYLQVPVHPASRRFLQFVAHGNVYQFSALCFGLYRAPQIFSRVMAPVSAILHSWGIRMRRYLNDWLVQLSSRESLLRDLRVVLDLCHELGIVVNPAKSHLVPSQVVQYLGVVVDSQSFRASPSPERVTRLRSTTDEFLSCTDPPASTWLSLLGILSSLSHLVPGGHLRVRSLQLCLHQTWDRVDQSVRIPWAPVCLRDLQWWLDLPRLSLGVSLAQVSPDLDFWSDASDVGRGAHLGSLTASGLWDTEHAALSINARELLAIKEGLLHFSSSLVEKNVAVFCDNSTAVSYLRKEGGTRSPFLNSLAQDILRWAESLSIRVLPQFIPGSLNVLADSLSPSPTSSYRVVSSSGGLSVYRSHVAGPNRLICHLSKSPMLHLFLSVQGSVGSGHRRLPPTLGRASGLRVSSVVCNLSGSSEAQVVSGDGTHPDSSLLASANLVCRSPSLVAGPSGGSASTSQPPAPASVSRPLPGSPQASSSCLATLRCFTRAAGFSSTVASQASLSRRPSSRKAYQLSRYTVPGATHGHSLPRPTLSKVAGFLCWLRSAKNLGVSSIRGYRFMLSAVFRFQLPSLSSHPVLRDHLRSFCLESAERQLRPPAWGLSLVLRFLNTSPFGPLSEAPLRALTQKVLFLIALATAKHVGELQALSSVVTFVHGDACLSYVPQFVAKSESLTRSIPRSSLVKSLSDFAAGLDDDLLLCPVRALRIYLDRLSSLSPLRHRLFVSPRRPTRPLSKNAVSFFLRDVITSAGASRPEVGRVRAHDIRGVSTSVAFHRNWSVSAVLESATWSSSSVFSSFYLRDLQLDYDGLLSLGPFVAAGTRIG